MDSSVVVVEPSVIVFGQYDWERPKRVSILATADAGGTTTIQHLAKSKDSRFGVSVPKASAEIKVSVMKSVASPPSSFASADSSLPPSVSSLSTVQLTSPHRLSLLQIVD